MNKIAIIIITITALLVSCSKTDVWLDHDDPTFYIPQSGVSINKVWMLESNEYTSEVEVYLGGARPDNQETNIKVTFGLDPSIISSYNNDITQEFAGQVILLPADCYQVDSYEISIPSGEVSGVLPIKIFTDKVEALGMGPDDIYAVPIKLLSSSKFRLSDEEGKTEVIYGVRLDQPMFYFYVNEAAGSSPVEIAKKVIYGAHITSIIQYP